MAFMKDTVHVNAVVSFAAVAMEVEFTQLLLLVWNHQLMFKLTLLSLQPKRGSTG